MTGLGSSCGACKFLRRRCTPDCVFAPYFCYEQAPGHFAAVHKVFGASNVSKLLLHLPVHSRSDAAITMSFEALARMNDPVYGCVAHIFALQQQVACLKEEIETIGNQMANVGETPECIFGNRHEFGQSMIIENCSYEQSVPVLHSERSLADEAWCTHMEMQLDEIFPGYFNSGVLERVDDELGQLVYYVHGLT